MAALQDELPGRFSEPSDLERFEYFHGLGGCPRLVARTSTTIWTPPDPNARHGKRLLTLGLHPILEAWCPALRSRLVAALDAAGDGRGGPLQWSYFYPLRVAMTPPRNLGQTRVVLFVGVGTHGDRRDDHNRTRATWAAALRAALRCRSILRDAGVVDVEVEVLESQCTPFASPTALPSPTSASTFPPPPPPPSLARSSAHAHAVLDKINWRLSSDDERTGIQPDPDIASLNSGLMRLLPFPGQSIQQHPGMPGDHSQQPATRQEAQQAKPASGTLGLYIQLQPKASATSTAEDATDTTDAADARPSRLYGLTCRHVAVGRRAPAHADIRSADAAFQQTANLQLVTGNNTAVYRCGEDVSQSLQRLKTKFPRTKMRYLRDPDNAYLEEDYSTQRDGIAYAQDMFRELKRIGAELDDNDAASLADRLLGSVADSPHYHVNRRGSYVDWALVGLQEAAATKAAGPAGSPSAFINRVYLPTPTPAAVFLGSELEWQPYEQLLSALPSPEPFLDAHGFLRLHGENLPRAPFGAFDADGATHRCPCIVAKRGATSGLTFGVTSEIEAVLRNPAGRPGALVAFSWLVLGLDGQPFSNPGDSGASVFDMTGRVLGMVDAGVACDNKDEALVRCFVKYREEAALPHVDNDRPLQAPIPDGFSRLHVESLLASSVREDAFRDGTSLQPVANPDVTFVTATQFLMESIEEFTGMQARIA